jgi:alkylhydroperoxidase family enzyme
MLLRTVEPGDATGRIKEIYDLFPPEVGVPRTLKLLSASPELLNRQFGFISYFREHPRLSPGFSAALRYGVAAKAGHTACEIFNRGLLRRMGLSDSEISQLTEDNVEKTLEPAEQALLDFVFKAVDSPASVTSQDVEELKNLGYLESDLLDAMVMAGNMVGSSLVWKTFGKD